MTLETKELFLPGLYILAVIFAGVFGVLEHYHKNNNRPLNVIKYTSLIVGVILGISSVRLAADISKKKSLIEAHAKFSADSLAMATNLKVNTNCELTQNLNNATSNLDEMVVRLGSTVDRIDNNLHSQTKLISQQSLMLSRQNDIVLKQNQTINHLGNVAISPFFPVDIKSRYFIRFTEKDEHYYILESWRNNSHFLNQDSLSAYGLELVNDKLFFEPKYPVDVWFDKPMFETLLWLYEIVYHFSGNIDFALYADSSQSDSSKVFSAYTESRVSKIVVDFRFRSLMFEMSFDPYSYEPIKKAFNSLKNIPEGCLIINDRPHDHLAKSFTSGIIFTCGVNKYIYDIPLWGDFIQRDDGYSRTYKIPVSSIIN